MRLLLTVAFTFLVVAALNHAQPAEPTGPKAVLVTGASTSIGRKITERLAADGYFVYATARKPEDLKALGTVKNVQAVQLDVTHPEDIAMIERRSSKCWMRRSPKRDRRPIEPHRHGH